MRLQERTSDTRGRGLHGGGSMHGFSANSARVAYPLPSPGSASRSGGWLSASGTPGSRSAPGGSGAGRVLSSAHESHE
eukprot:5743664-Alexandrium_andersonii.AAC.1